MTDYVQLIIDIVRREPGMYNDYHLIEKLGVENAGTYIRKARRTGEIVLKHAKSVVPGIYLGKRYFPKGR